MTATATADLPTEIETPVTSTFFLQCAGDHVFLGSSLLEGNTLIEQVEAPDRQAARLQLNNTIVAARATVSAIREIAVQKTPQETIHAVITHCRGTFRNLNDALRYAFLYAGQQSPHSPMSSLMNGPALGSGAGLVGVDGAGQAGMILGALDRILNADQRTVIVVRFGSVVQVECPCCGTQGPPSWWNEAVASLSLIETLRDLPKPIREAVVKKTVGRQKIRVQSAADGYEVTERQIRRRISAAREHFAKIENAALGVLQGHFAKGDEAGLSKGQVALIEAC